MSVPTGLPVLEARLRSDLDLLDLPAKSWVPPRIHEGGRVRDVVVVGAGMCGLVALAALRFAGIGNIVAFDRSPAGHEGPWVTFARMETLRSPKHLTGPALGLPALTFRAWFEARFGPEEWDRLDKIPRTMWMDYLVWYRHVLDLPVENEIGVKAITPAGSGLLAVAIENLRTGTVETVHARRVVLATGRDGLGAPYVPHFAKSVDRRFWAHSADAIDFDALRGKAVAVVGAGASAMDNAATALEAGVGSVDLFVRRKDLPRVNKFTGISSQGVVNGFVGLPDAWKWRFLHHTLGAQTPPPRDSTLRVSRYENARFHLGSPVLAMEQEGERVRLTTPHGSYVMDYAILATGFDVSAGGRPELAAFSGNIASWADRFSPPPGMENAELSNSPYLGPSFEFVEKVESRTPGLSLVHAFNYPATLSHGKLSGDIPAVSDGARRLAAGIARSLFVEDREIHFEALVAYDIPELEGDEWVDCEALPAAERWA